MTGTVDIVFKILNFLVVCIGAGYLIFRYGILHILMLMRHDKKQKEEMLQKHQDLLQQNDAIQLQGYDQELSYQAMQETFRLWQLREQKQELEKKAWLRRYQQELEQKQIIKLQNVQRQYVLKKQMPKMLQEISEDLRATFDKSPQKQKKYIDQLVTFVKERDV